MGAVSLLYNAVRNFEIAFITLFVGLLISRIVGKIVKRLLAEAELNKLFAARGAKSINEIVGSTVEGLLYFVTVLIVFQQLGLTKIVFYLILILLVTILGILIFIGFKQFQNIFAWFMLRPILNKKLGKTVEIGDIKGKLQSISFVQSRVKGAETFLIPHAYSWKKLKKIREERRC